MQKRRPHPSEAENTRRFDCGPDPPLTPPTRNYRTPAASILGQNTRELRSVAAESLAGLLVFLVADSAAVAVFAELGEFFRRLFGREGVGLLG